jgi:Bifunctional DNA primase/polymerase, N-terminal
MRCGPVNAQPATTRPSPEELRGAALEYAARGVPVLPLRGKLPLIPAAHPPADPLHLQCHGGCGSQGHGVHDATTNPDRLRDWWDRWPHANVGLRTGVAFDVIDVDGQTGRQSLERLLAEHGGGMPIGGPRVRTGSGGWHLYVEPTGLPDRIGVLPSVDYRAADRYVVAPPSRHPVAGRRYQWTPGRGLDTPLGQVPAALRERLTPHPVDRRQAPATVRPAEPGHPYGRTVLEAETGRIVGARGPDQGCGGERNQVLWEAARNLYNLVAGGVLDEAEVAGELERAAGACGLLRDEPRQTRRTLASARQVGMAHPRGIPERPAGGAHGQDRPQPDASHHQPFQPPDRDRARER